MTSNANLLTVQNVSIPSSSEISIRDHSAITMQKKQSSYDHSENRLFPLCTWSNLSFTLKFISLNVLGREKSKRTGIKQMLSLKSIPGSIPARSLAGLQSCGHGAACLTHCTLFGLLLQCEGRVNTVYK